MLSIVGLFWFLFLISKLDLRLRSLSLELFESPYGVEKKKNNLKIALATVIIPEGNSYCCPERRAQGLDFKSHPQDYHQNLTCSMMLMQSAVRIRMPITTVH